MANSKFSLLKYLLILVATASVVLPLVALILFAAGNRSGTEFSPTDFTRRQFTYNKTPLFGFVVQKKTYQDITTDLETSLILDGWIQPAAGVQKWDLVTEGYIENRRWPAEDCDARFLTHYLDMTNDDGDDYWMVWNDSFPKSAKVFWPFVAELAREKLYLKIPHLMRFGIKTEKDEPKQFKQELEKRIASYYLEMGRIDFDLGRLKKATRRIKRSGELDPSSEFQSTWSEIQGSTGELEEGQ